MDKAIQAEKVRMRRCVSNLDAYLKTLQDTNINFLRIIIKHNQEPVITVNTVQKHFKAKEIEPINEDLYIVRNTGTDGYCYIYRKSAITYSVTTNAGTVVAWEKEPGYSQLQGGAVVKQVHWGDHITVGLIISYKAEPKQLLLVSHKSSFTSCLDDDTPTRVQKNQNDCNTFFQDDLNAQTACVREGVHMNMTMEHAYCDVSKDPDILHMVSAMKHIYEGAYSALGGGVATKREYVQCNGKRYLVRSGPRGGRFIQVQGEGKRYIKCRGRGHAQHGGAVRSDFVTENGTAFKNEFAEFIRDAAVRQVLQLRPQLSSATVIYDGESDGFMIMYEYGDDDLDLANQFFVDAELARRAFTFESIGEAGRAALEPTELDELRNAREQFGQMFVTVAA
jgi:hypothetical protein